MFRLVNLNTNRQKLLKCNPFPPKSEKALVNCGKTSKSLVYVPLVSLKKKRKRGEIF